ncbi:aromatic hydrocarbon degradation protein [Thiohalocapsa halophila]|uniref:Aromatic hydrocarbon degradation protein n=1 Tax=Thiohalocapsa halophila TaxID=69359 RepID=A0ABS1CEX6_9GAMM|nr:porin [Thiohalocapsa halophila]MBK1630467.1 aromatic hydrocarbon degradation protein [Thiohalocapsa halophila]
MRRANFELPTLAAAVLGLCASSNAVAGGFAVPELSTAGIGTTNALVANPDERGAIVYNPAAMAFHDQSSINTGLLLLAPDSHVDIPGGGGDATNADWFVAPMIQAAIRINEDWSAGLGVTAPFGLETRWAPNTFPALTGRAALPSPPFAPGSSVPLSPQPTQSKLEIVNFTPTATYRVTPELALSAGADIYWAKAAQLDSTITELEGEGTGWGFNLSAMYVKDRFSAGINFHSAPTVSLDGTFSVLDPNLVLLGAAPPSQTAELDVDLPWRLQVGVRYEIIQDQLAVELDWTRNGWSEFQEIKVVGDRTGTTLIEDQNQWDDSNAFRLGLTYNLVEQTQLRLGYSFDETPQGDEFFSARVPDNDRHLFGLGVAHKLNDRIQLELGYMYVMLEDRDFRSTRPYDPVNAPGDINGTTALNGDYSSEVHLIGLELSTSFDAF